MQGISPFSFSKKFAESCATAGDWLDLRDGDNQNSSLITRLCGMNTPLIPIKTTANNIFIHMHTDSSGNYRGFILEYKGKSDIHFVEFLIMVCIECSFTLLNCSCLLYTDVVILAVSHTEFYLRSPLITIKLY